jgi:hypothetical protein
MLRVKEGRDGLSNLLPALYGRLDRVGEVAVLAAENTQIKEWEASGEGFARDDVVEQGERCASQPPALRIGVARIVNGAERRWPSRRLDRIQHGSVLSLESLPHISKEAKRSTHGLRGMLEHAGHSKRIVAADAQH